MEGFTPEQKITYAERMWFLIRNVYPTLTNSEWVALTWLVERTVSFKKIEETIRRDHFYKGISWGGATHIQPIKLSESTLKRALIGLEKKKIIERRAINGSPHTKYIVTILREVGQNDERPRSKLPHDLGQNEPAYINKERIINGCALALTRSHTRTETVSSPMENIKAAIEAASAKSKERREVRKGKNNASSYQLIWRDAFHATYPDDQWFQWRTYEISAFKKALTRGVPKGEEREFIEYVVINYGKIISEKFKWMRSVSPTPVVGFIAKHVEQFYAAFTDSKNPNRKLATRVRNGEGTAPSDNVIKPKDDSEAKAIAALRAKVAMLEKENAAIKSGKQIHETGSASARRILDKPRTTTDGELGSWDDQPRRTGKNIATPVRLRFARKS